MNFTFQKLSQAHALEIADCWKYDGEYAFYDMTADPEDYEEFTDESRRSQNDYFEALCGGTLAGFFCVLGEGASLEIGLGLKPELCGRGIGTDFLRQILAFIERHYDYDALILSVAAFNRRAINVYRACGFADAGVTQRETNGGTYAFFTLKKNR